MMRGWHMTDGWMGGWMILGLIFWIVFLVGLVLLAVWAFQRFAAGGGGPRGGESALDILKKRYARGEISKEEFEERKRDLS